MSHRPAFATTRSRPRLTCAGLALAVLPAGMAYGGTLLPIYSFTRTGNGGPPLFNAQPIVSGAGVVFGTAGLTSKVSPNHLGNVFSLKLQPGATTWTHKIIHGFQNNGITADGYGPQDGIAFGPKGSIYGFAAFNGPVQSVGCGIVYQLLPPPVGSSTWTENILYTFPPSGGFDGCRPVNGKPLVTKDGSIYGTTEYGGGPEDWGTVFKLTPPATAGGSWTETVLHRFTSPFLGALDGSHPEGSVVQDSAGNLYGTTYDGGLSNLGTIWELTPAGDFSVLYNFAGGKDGANPEAGLVGPVASTVVGVGMVFFYGTTSAGGGAAACTGGCGTAFEAYYTPSSTNGSRETGTFTEVPLHVFTGGTDGATPQAALTLVKSALWGTTTNGGASALGTIFKLAQGRFGLWTYDDDYSFSGGADGATPITGLGHDTAGNLYGMNQGGFGKVFEYVP
jgi:uncharacterized repeat protein (TIGR03803 family)